MKRIRKALKALGLLIRNPWKLNLILDHNEEWEQFVRGKYGKISLPVIPLNSIIRDTILVEPFAFLDGGSIPTDIALLKQLATDIPGCRYFEIGTWRGESVSNVSAVSEVCYTLNLPDEELFRQINQENYVSSQRFFSKDRTNIKQLFGNSAAFNYNDLNLKFDLIFIDGDHHYEAIVKDTRNMLKYLCHPGSIIVWHDYTYTPESIRYETLAAILDACPAEMHSCLFHVKNTNCAMLYRKETASVPFEKFARPDCSFALQIRMNPV
jgi:predicted O-methyltransferase YrrM